MFLHTAGRSDGETFQSRFLQPCLHIKGNSVSFFIERSCCLAADTAPLLLLAGCVATLRHSATVLQLLGLGTKSSCRAVVGCVYSLLFQDAALKKKTTTTTVQ